MKIRSLVFLLLINVTVLFAQTESASVTRPLITGIAHASFYTKDVQEDKAFYSNYLGYSDTLLSNKKGPYQSTTIVINQDQTIELLPEIYMGGNRFHHFAITTASVQKMFTYLKNKNVAPTNISKDANGNKRFFVTDPNGTLCEIIQLKKQKENNMHRRSQSSQNVIANRMSHVGFMVPDVNKAIDFYGGILGFQEIWRGSKDGKNVTWVNLQVPNGKDYIELMLYDTQQSEENMSVLNHLCLEVDDVTVSAKTLAGKTLPSNVKTPTAIKTGINKKRQINCYDIDGTRVEIMEANTVTGTPAPSSTAPPLKFAKQK